MIDAQRLRRDDLRVVGGLEKGVHRGGDGAASTVAEHHRQLQAVEVTRGILHAAEALGAQHVPGHPHREDVVHAALEDRLERHPGVGAAQHRGERLLRERLPAAPQPQVARIEGQQPAAGCAGPRGPAR